jgi:hypothetical protein
VVVACSWLPVDFSALDRSSRPIGIGLLGLVAVSWGEVDEALESVNSTGPGRVGDGSAEKLVADDRAVPASRAAVECVSASAFASGTTAASCEDRNLAASSAASSIRD